MISSFSPVLKLFQLPCGQKTVSENDQYNQRDKDVEAIALLPKGKH
jgi:hypothetical protein